MMQAGKYSPGYNNNNNNNNNNIMIIGAGMDLRGRVLTAHVGGPGFHLQY